MSGTVSEETTENRLKDAEERIRRLEKRNRILYRELTRRERSLPSLLPKFHRPGEIPIPNGANEAPVDIFFTVRNTFDLLVPCLKSVFANTDVPFRLFVNDNASDDRRTPELLLQYRDRHPGQVEVLLQSENLGVVDAINLLLKRTTNDVIMLNADAEMPPGWTSRLLWPLRHSGAKVAAAAPFCTAAVFGGFPVLGVENELFEGMALAEVDAVFQTARRESFFTAPFAPGFCMAMSRRALDEVGLYDAESFRPAYGDEADWCYRAAARGYSNVLVPNLFAFHKHQATMKKEKSIDLNALGREKYAIMLRKHPTYENDRHDFNDSPSYQAFHSFMIMQASIARCGGVEVAFAALGAEKRAGNPETARLTIGQQPKTGEFFLDFGYKTHRAEFTAPTYNWVIKLLHRLSIRAITVETPPPGVEPSRFEGALARLRAKAIPGNV